MTRRFATIILHWSNLIVLLLLMAAGSESAVLGWVFVASSTSMTALAVLKGLLNGPGPVLEGTLRVLHPWLSRLMYCLLGWSALAVLFGLLGMRLPGPDTDKVLFIMIGASLLHGCFHLWRASALNDGALRRMLP